MTSFEDELKKLLNKIEDEGYEIPISRVVSEVTSLLSDRDRRVIERVKLNPAAYSNIEHFYNTKYVGDLFFGDFLNLPENKSSILKLTDENEKCEWKWEAFEECYSTDCNNSFIIDGRPQENNFKYCPFCGREIVEKLPSGKD